ncbi:hypothetical protein Nepgr_021497 [Nepenthes gracilis]|uniref:FAM91 C-terminal domain-containing protein n=1 Tax=Nepenthes gracilis TaxID=150966 RepID=A0AAD3T118_NEPGR|nr:hypothetical protein Nepgr_021497 [Nepenthes gracilis]
MRISNPLNFPILPLSNGSMSIQCALQSLYSSSNGLNYGAYGDVIQFCADRRLISQGKQLHSRLILCSVTPNNYLASKLLTFYAKTGHLYHARKVFDQIPQKNTFSYNCMLIAYSNHNKLVQILELFSSFVDSSTLTVKPDNFTVTCVLKALSCLYSDANLAREIHCHVLRHGFVLDLFVANALITNYSRCDEMDVARKLFDSMSERDVVSWNSIISGYAQGGYYEDCLKMYRVMLDTEKFKPNGVTVASVLQACAQLKDLVFGMEVHQLVLENDIEMDITVCNSVIGLYAKCGSLDYARELFETMSEKDEISYGCLMTGYMIHGYVDEAIVLFREMKSPRLSTWNALISGLVQNSRHAATLDLVREMQASHLRPNSVTLSSMLPTLSFFSNLKAGKEVHAYAIRNNLNENIYVSASIIDTYAKAGFLHGARQIFNQTRDKSVIIWTAIIAAYAAHGDSNEAVFLFEDMLSNGKQPDPVTFTAVLSACSHSGAVDEAWKIFNGMYSKHGIAPMAEHYACMVGVLSRSGKLSYAAKFISRMPFDPSPKVWGALLNGALVFGDVELGKFACDHLFEIEPENTGNYIVMANLYWRAGRWEEAKKMREKMEAVGLKKIPGSSWIETSRGLKSFVAGDTCHGQTEEEVYEMLDGLLGLMKEEDRASVIEATIVFCCSSSDCHPSCHTRETVFVCCTTLPTFTFTDPSYRDWGFWKRLGYQYICGFSTRWKYYFIWSISEAAIVISGFGFTVINSWLKTREAGIQKLVPLKTEHTRPLEMHSVPPPQNIGWWCIYATISSSSLEDYKGCGASPEPRTLGVDVSRGMARPMQEVMDPIKCFNPIRVFITIDWRVPIASSSLKDPPRCKMPYLDDRESVQAESANGVASLQTSFVAIFVVASENATVAELAATLQVDLSQLQAAASFACQLGWAVKLIDPASVLQDANVHGSLNINLSDDEDGSQASVSSANMSTDGNSVQQDYSGMENNKPAFNTARVAFIVDANITSYLMMGSVSPGLKFHAVTLYEAGKLGHTCFGDLCKDLSTLEGAKFDGELQEFANHASSLLCVLECLLSGGVSASVREVEGCDGMDLSSVHSIVINSTSVDTTLTDKPEHASSTRSDLIGDALLSTTNKFGDVNIDGNALESDIPFHSRPFKDGSVDAEPASGDHGRRIAFSMLPIDAHIEDAKSLPDVQNEEKLFSDAALENESGAIRRKRNYYVDPLRCEEVDPLPSMFKQIIKRMVRWHILLPSCVPNSCIVNIYDEGDCIPPHTDHHDFLRPFCAVSF